MANRVTGTCCTASVERAGLPGLLRDLQRLSEDQDSADIVFILGTAEEKVYAHKIILIARCKSFQNTKRGEVCRIPGCTVSPSSGPQPTPIRMPHVQPETFRLFIQYVYTGKLLLQDSGVFEMMTLAADLGVEDLRAACEDHVTSTLSVESACTLLAAAMEIQDRPGGKSASSFMERCIAFIGDNASDCVKTNSFLNLPKDALIKLISSDFVSISVLGGGGGVALRAGVGQAARRRGAAHRALDGGGARARLPPPGAAHAAHATAAHRQHGVRGGGGADGRGAHGAVAGALPPRRAARRAAPRAATRARQAHAASLGSEYVRRLCDPATRQERLSVSHQQLVRQPEAVVAPGVPRLHSRVLCAGLPLALRRNRAGAGARAAEPRPPAGRRVQRGLGGGRRGRGLRVRRARVPVRAGRPARALPAHQEGLRALLPSRLRADLRRGCGPVHLQQLPRQQRQLQQPALVRRRPGARHARARLQLHRARLRALHVRPQLT